MGEKECKIAVDGMTCVSCASSIEKILKKKPGVLEANVHFAKNRATVIYDPATISEKSILEGVREAGYEGSIIGHQHTAIPSDREEKRNFHKFLVAALLTLPLMLDMVGMIFGVSEKIPAWIQFVFASVVLFYSGASFFRSSYYSLKAKSANMDVLIALGASAAYFYSAAVLFLGIHAPHYFETSAMIITLILLGRWLEARSKRKASEAIEKMIQLQPSDALVKKNGNYLSIPTSEIEIGDLFLIRPGERVAVDGEVVEGESSIDESSLTGESLPVYKEAGERVFAGTMNSNGSLTVKATGVGAMTTLSRMIKLVEEAQSSKAPVQKLADQISEIFVPVVTAISLLTFVGWLLVGGSVSTALINAVAVLVIACPCALGLATPTVIMVATGRGAELGVLFKEAEALETAQKLNLLIVDKTGTLTKGRPELEEVIPEKGADRKEALVAAASLSHHSTHPLSEAIVRLAEHEKLAIEPVSDIESLAGKGIKGKKRAETLFLGSARLAEEQGIAFDPEKIARFQKAGKTVSLLWNERGVIAYFVISDTIRDGAKKAIDRLHDMGVSVIMMTGDSENTAKSVAETLGIEKFFASVLPEQKAAKVREVKGENLVVGMVGDGVNDAPALATADVGFAIDRGSDVAIETADVTLLNGDIMGVVKAIDLSKISFRKIKQNLFFAFFYNALGIPLAAFGFLNPIFAAAAMAASSLSVVSNALLLRRWKPK